MKEDDRVVVYQGGHVRSTKASRKTKPPDKGDGQTGLTKPRPPPSGWSRSLHLRGGENQPTTKGDMGTPLEGVVSAGKGPPRAVNTRKVINYTVTPQSNTLGDKLVTGITVNGVRLMDMQRLRGSVKKSTPGKGKKPAQKKQENKVSTTPSSGNIKKLLVRKPAQGVRKEEEEEECETKKEDTDKKKIVGVRENNVDKEEKENYQDEENEENNKKVKKTFRDLETGTFRKKMMRFKVMSEGRDCIIRSGW